MNDTTNNSAGGYSALALNYITGLANISLAKKQAAVGQTASGPAVNGNAVTNSIVNGSGVKIALGVLAVLAVVVIIKKLKG